MNEKNSDLEKIATSEKSAEKETQYVQEHKPTIIEKIFVKLYWLIVAMFYLAFSVFTGLWHISWVIFPVAAILFASIKNSLFKK